MQKLSADLERPISVVTDTSATTEQLLEKVSEGIIDYTICNEKTANFVGSLFNNLDFSTPIAFDQEFSWLVANKSTKWKNILIRGLWPLSNLTGIMRFVKNNYSESANGIFSQKKFIRFWAANYLIMMMW
jgi:membrane-bound lytic murein transglycosylase MltF